MRFTRTRYELRPNKSSFSVPISLSLLLVPWRQQSPRKLQLEPAKPRSALRIFVLMASVAKVCSNGSFICGRRGILYTYLCCRVYPLHWLSTANCWKLQFNAYARSLFPFCSPNLKSDVQHSQIIFSTVTNVNLSDTKETFYCCCLLSIFFYIESCSTYAMLLCVAFA